MFERISRSWGLVKASYAVLKADRELIIFPLLSMLGVIIVTITFIVPMALLDLINTTEGQEGLTPLGYVVTFLFYVVMYTIIIFANSALVGAALIRLRGGDPTVRDGFNIAMQHISQIIGFAIISATVGMILRAISERGGIIGQIAASLVGFAWNVATFLVIPILVNEDIGPIEAIKRSGSMIKKTWGEQIAGDLSIGLIFFFITLGALLIGIPLAILAASLGAAALVVVIALLVIVVIGINLVGSTLSGIYRAALYQYATEGAESNVTNYFDEAMIHGAFRVKA